MTALGSDVDHALCGMAAIEHRSLRALHERYRLDLGRADIVHVAGHTVDEHEEAGVIVGVHAPQRVAVEARHIARYGGVVDLVDIVLFHERLYIEYFDSAKYIVSVDSAISQLNLALGIQAIGSLFPGCGSIDGCHRRSQCRKKNYVIF